MQRSFELSHPQKTPVAKRAAALNSIYAPTKKPEKGNFQKDRSQARAPSPMDTQSPLPHQTLKKQKMSDSILQGNTPKTHNPKHVNGLPQTSTLNQLLDTPESESEEELDIIGNSILEAGPKFTTIEDPATGESKNAKPIQARIGMAALHPIINAMTLKKRPLLKRVNPKETQIICGSVEDKIKVIKRLVDQKIQHFFYQERTAKPLLFVLKGLCQQKCTQVLESLLKEDIPALKVTPLSNNPDFPVFLVHFQRGVQTVTLRLLRQRRAIDSIIVTWEAYDLARKRLTQCSKCHRHGHPASGCNMAPRCIKCLLTHDTGMCARQTRDQDGTPQCVNCQGNHAANSRTCPSYISYSRMVNSHRGQQKPTQRHVSQNNNSHNHRASPSYAYTQSNFPNLNIVPEIQRSETIPLMRISPLSQPAIQNVRAERTEQPSSHPSVANIFDELSHAQQRFAALPDIEYTIRSFITFVNDMANAKSESERRTLLIRYSTPNAN